MPCSLGTLEPGGSATVIATALATTAGTFTSTAPSFADQFDPNGTNNQAFAQTAVNAAALKADLSVQTTDAPDPVVVNGELVYTVSGDERWTVERDFGPVGTVAGIDVSFISSSPMACDVTAQAAACPIGSLASGASTVTVTIRVRATAAGIRSARPRSRRTSRIRTAPTTRRRPRRWSSRSGRVGAGTFGPRVIYPAGTNAEIAGIGDFDEDGVADVVVSNDSGQARGIQLLLGNGGGTFAPPVYFQAGSDGLSVADFDRDGNLDVVTGSEDDQVHRPVRQRRRRVPAGRAIPDGPEPTGGAFARELTGDGFVRYRHRRG